LSLLLNADAVVAHYQGDHAHAIESLRQGILLARITAKQRSLLAGLFACGENVVAAREAEQISPTLHIGTGTGDTTPAQVRALIDDLLQDAASHRAFHDCLLGERMCELDSCRDEVGGLKQPSASAGRTAKVVLLHNTATLLQYTTKVVGAADLPNYPAAQAGLPNIPARSGKAISSLSDSLVSLLGPSLIYALKGAFQSYTEDRLAAVALAARWYAVEHDGKLPATLNDLVPRYLPEIPLDPMAAGKPLGYIANKDRTLVYSVGESGIDEQANETRMDPEHVTGGGPHTWRARNFVVHLEPAH